jgi:hypothetical protein
VVVQHPAGRVVEYRFTVCDDDMQEAETQGTLQPNGTVKLSRRRSSGSKNSSNAGGGTHKNNGGGGSSLSRLAAATPIE